MFLNDNIGFHYLYTDAGFADRLLDHSKRLFAFADAYRGYYSKSIPDAQSFYGYVT